MIFIVIAEGWRHQHTEQPRLPYERGYGSGIFRHGKSRPAFTRHRKMKHARRQNANQLTLKTQSVEPPVADLRSEEEFLQLPYKKFNADALEAGAVDWESVDKGRMQCSTFNMGHLDNHYFYNPAPLFGGRLKFEKPE